MILDDKDTISIMGLTFHKTCDMCPEQYDVYKGKKYVAYIRLRSGWLRVYPDVGSNEPIYEKIYDNIYKGQFTTQNERMAELRNIAKAIKKRKI